MVQKVRGYRHKHAELSAPITDVFPSVLWQGGSTPKWQGVEDSSATPLRSVHKTKCQKQKSMQRRQATSLLHVVEKGAECEEERQAERDGGKFRKVVGHITSAAARGR